MGQAKRAIRSPQRPATLALQPPSSTRLVSPCSLSAAGPVTPAPADPRPWLHAGRSRPCRAWQSLHHRPGDNRRACPHLPCRPLTLTLFLRLLALFCLARPSASRPFISFFPRRACVRASIFFLGHFSGRCRPGIGTRGDGKSSAYERALPASHVGCCIARRAARGKPA